jgi:hypothetical protein
MIFRLNPNPSRHGRIAPSEPRRPPAFDADSFWADAYFEERQLASIGEVDPASINGWGSQ